NVLLVSGGILTATLASATARTHVMAKSPLTGLLGSTNMGGFFAPELAWAGFHHLVIKGKAKEPVYLFVHDGKIEIRSAKKLWGWTTTEPQWAIREELKDERFADVNQRMINGRALDELLIEAAKDRTMAEMFKTASERYRLLFGIVQTPADLARCAQLEAREFYQDVEHPVIGKIKVPFGLWSMTETPARCRRPAPLLGQHNAEVYTQLLGYAEDDVMRLRETGVI
ncbi:MAG: CoA transferase, partial [candidate division NC10 bacterium]|nr:CoA transferase [candidate division NC10 bacterium]